MGENQSKCENNLGYYIKLDTRTLCMNQFLNFAAMRWTFRVLDMSIYIKRIQAHNVLMAKLQMITTASPDIEIFINMLYNGFISVPSHSAGTGHKMLFVPFVFSKSRFQGPAFRCDIIVVILTLLEAIEGIPDKDYNFKGSDIFHNLYERLLHERKLKSGYLEKRIYERPLHLRVNHLSRINLYVNLL